MESMDCIAFFCFRSDTGVLNIPVFRSDDVSSVCGNLEVLKIQQKTTFELKLDNVKGNEIYKMKLIRSQGRYSYPAADVRSNCCSVFRLKSGYYTVECTVFLPSTGNAGATPETSFIGYCKKMPEMLMTFKCGDREVKAVKLLMCSLSTVIETMMTSDFIESKTNTVEIQEFSADVIDKMVEFCETNGIEETTGFELELCKAANYFNIEPLKALAASKAEILLTRQNLIEMLQFSETYNNDFLSEKCITYAKAHRFSILFHSDVSDIDPHVLKKLWIAISPYSG